MIQPRDIPQIPDSVEPNLRRSLSRMREIVQLLIATRGDGNLIKSLTDAPVIVGSTLQSDNYVTGVSGWRLLLSGAAEFWQAAINGTLRTGASPAISGTTMTGVGALFNADGTFCIGTSAGNITYNGTGKPILNGLDQSVATLSTYSVTFTATPDGVVTSGLTFPVVLSVRNAGVDEAASWTFAVSDKSASSITTTSAGTVITITGMGNTIDVGWIEVTASRSGYTTLGPMRVNVAKVKSAAPSSGPVANPGSFYAQGYTVSPTDSFSEVEFRSDGTIYSNSSNAGVRFEGNWYLPTTAGIGSGYQVTFALTTGSAITTVNGSLVSNRKARLTNTNNSFSSLTSTVSYTLQTSGGSAVSSGSVFLTSEVDI